MYRYTAMNLDVATTTFIKFDRCTVGWNDALWHVYVEQCAATRLSVADKYV